MLRRTAISTSHEEWYTESTYGPGIDFYSRPHVIVSLGEPVGFQAVRAIKVKCRYCGRKNNPEHDMCAGCNAPLAMQ